MKKTKIFQKMKMQIFLALFLLLFVGCYSQVSQKTNEVNSNDPCNDKILKQLEQKDSLSTDEMKVYVELKKLCSENENTSRRLDQTEELTNNYSAYLFISLFAGAMLLIWLSIHNHL